MTKSRDKNKNVFYITHSGELLFWLVIIFVIVALSTIVFIHKEKNDENDYQVFFNDVDGLIVGSPVRMMGIEVGHVTKIKPIENEVYVKFVLTNPDVYLPPGTAVTVEFSGMAGSKSLELYLPDKNSYQGDNNSVLVVCPPKRLHDAMGLLNDMYKKLTSIIYTSSSFGNKINEIKTITPSNSPNFKNFLQYSNKFLDDSNEKAVDFRKSLGLDKVEGGK